jgi:hypothetical protein
MRSDAATPLHLAATAEAALGRIDPAVARILDRALSGEAISSDDALALWQTTGPELQALCQAADELRRRAVGDAITYVVNRNINWTNICFTDCSFCAFGVSARDPSAYFHPPERVTEKALEAWARGATEVCMQGGLAAQLTPERYLEYLRAVKDPLPEMHVHAFSPAEIDWAMRKWDGSLEEYLTMLRQAGLDTIPGTAAEILVDEVRREIAPKKLMTARWREIITTAHRVGLRSTGTRPISHTSSRMRSGARYSPAVAPAMREIDSSISVPEKSLAPHHIKSWLIFSPSLTQETWRLSIRPWKKRRGIACARRSSVKPGPGRPSPSLYRRVL